MPAFPPGANLKGGRNAAPVLAEEARKFYAPLIPIVVELHEKGLSLRKIGDELNKRGIPARYGYQAGWSAAQVRRVLLRAAEQAPATAAPMRGNEGVSAAPASVSETPTAASRMIANDNVKALTEAAPANSRHVKDPPKPDIKAAEPAPAPQPVPDRGRGPESEAGNAAAVPPKAQAQAPLAGIQLWLGGHPKGPFTESQVKAMLETAAITLDTRFHRPGMAVWRPLRELFPGISTQGR